MDDVKKVSLTEDYTEKIALLDMCGKTIHDCRIGIDNEETLDYIKKENRELLQVQNKDFTKESLELYISENGSFTLKFTKGADGNAE